MHGKEGVGITFTISVWVLVWRGEGHFVHKSFGNQFFRSFLTHQSKSTKIHILWYFLISIHDLGFGANSLFILCTAVCVQNDYFVHELTCVQNDRKPYEGISKSFWFSIATWNGESISICPNYNTNSNSHNVTDTRTRYCYYLVLNMYEYQYG